MLLVRNANSFPFDRVRNGSVVTIGAFDGLHRGHQKLLDAAFSASERLCVPSVLVSFEPTPKEFFAGDSPPARLMRFREKFDALQQAGVDVFFCPRFDSAMRDIAADTFIRRLLVHTLNLRELVIGDDFHFARRREGNVTLLRRAGIALNFKVTQVPSVVVGGERVSSTAIRDALWNGEMERATRLLGRPYRMSGRVVPGQSLGRDLGYPTANVNLQRRQSAVMGIFAVRVHGVDTVPLDAVASVGTRPTFDGVKPLLEVHIFDFNRDIYGSYIHVEFVARLREERKFDSADALIEQMDIDSRQAREILAA
ncbi:MAG: bifunctional riboflavin kinase/FAD synthetase [Pseudomonadota bacterium]